ncbi:MAG: hypothetical protein WBG17_12235 [Burkholderiaceae bacterium]
MTSITVPLRSAVPVYGALLSVLVFQNIFNTFSPYLTLAINIAVATTLLIRHQLRFTPPAPIVVVSVYAVLAWMLLVTVFRGDAESQIVLKYFRTTLAVSLFALIFGSCRIPASSVVKAINFALGFHILLVMLQLALPDLTMITAPVFGFEREMTIFETYTLRKLGASSSYDTASLLSIAALLFFYFQFKQGKGSMYFLMAAVAFVATLMSSRTGMALSFLVAIALFLQAILKARLIWKLVIVFGFAGFLVAMYITLFPLLLQTLGLTELQSDDASFVFAATDYGTTGTLVALTEDHLKPLDQPLSGLIIGFGVDPNTIGLETDIGYVKLIYHVGIVGTLVILFTHLYMLIATYMFAGASVRDSDRALIARFLFALIAISLAFNYKSLELHSRGIGDFIYMLFLFLASGRGIRGGSGNPSNKKAQVHS